MREVIMEKLKTIEANHAVKVIFACEGGSRSWGLASEKSDYDVRFIYLHAPHWYLSIEEKRNVIDVSVQNNLDIHGWDLKKTLNLLNKSNPSLLEWLNTPEVYFENNNVMMRMRQLSNDAFSPTTSIHHYLNMAERNFKNLIQNNEKAAKSVFYILKPLLACKWIEKYNTIPPVPFSRLLDGVMVEEDKLYTEIVKLKNLKTANKILSFQDVQPLIQKYIEGEITHLKQYRKTMCLNNVDHTDALDQLFRLILEKYWGNKFQN